MYRKDSTGWIKHVDFIILDLICLQVAFVLAYALSGYGANPYQLILYRNMAAFMEVADLVVLFAMGTLKNVLKRGYYKDFVVTAQHGVILGACLLLYLFMLQEGQQYSRLALVLNIVIYILLTYLVRELWKHLLRKKMEDGENRRKCQVFLQHFFKKIFNIVYLLFIIYNDIIRLQLQLFLSSFLKKCIEKRLSSGSHFLYAPLSFILLIFPFH